MTDDGWEGFFAWAELRGYLRAGRAFRLAHPGDPDLEVFADAGATTYGFRVAADHDGGLPPSPLASITVRRTTADGLSVIEVACDNPLLFEDFHALAALFAQRLRVRRLDPLTALEDVLTSLGRLIARSAVLPIERQIGLWGELQVLRAHSRSVGVTRAVKSWCAPRGEEHDFVLENVDVEVKTASGETPLHVIHGFKQLEPKKDRRLFLLSVLVTDGGDAGLSLPGLISQLRAALESAGQDVVQAFERGLQRSGWRDEYAPYCEDRWLLRRTPRVIDVEDLPALVPGVVSIPEADLVRLSDLRYTLDVTGLGVEVLSNQGQAIMPMDFEVTA